MKKYTATALCLALFLATAFLAAQETEPADFNGDGTINFADFLLFAQGFGKSAGQADFNAKLDLNADGTIDFEDFHLFVNAFAVVEYEITVCSFNIKFVGLYKKKDNKALAELVGQYDMVVVQELVAPPDNGQYCDGTPYREDPEADAFFNAMSAQGFAHSLSCEDTGSGQTIHKQGSSTEWSVVFYKPGKLALADDLPHGFLAEDRSAHPVYRRVPHAHSFRTADGRMDFVVVNVHLYPGNREAEKRKAELLGIANWIDQNDSQERDFYIVGDMNIQDAAELEAATPPGFVSLNDECRKTNTATGSDKPYDHVLYRPAEHPESNEVDEAFDFQVVNLIDAMRDSWRDASPYPGDPYSGNLFAQYYSDHHPVLFRLVVPSRDDD